MSYEERQQIKRFTKRMVFIRDAMKRKLLQHAVEVDGDVNYPRVAGDLIGFISAHSEMIDEFLASECGKNNEVAMPRVQGPGISTDD